MSTNTNDWYPIGTIGLSDVDVDDAPEWAIDNNIPFEEFQACLEFLYGDVGYPEEIGEYQSPELLLANARRATRKLRAETAFLAKSARAARSTNRAELGAGKKARVAWKRTVAAFEAATGISLKNLNKAEKLKFIESLSKA